MDLTTKLLTKSKENKSFLSIWTYNDDEKFWFGKILDFNDELVIIAAVAFVTGVICLAITLLGGGNEKVKRWGVGLIVAGILVFVAPDLGNFFFN